MKTGFEKKLKRWITLILPLLIMGLILAACDGDNDNQNDNEVGGGGGLSNTPGAAETAEIETPVIEVEDTPEMVETATVAATEEIAEPTAVVSPTVDSTDVTPEATVGAQGTDGVILASDLIGIDVEDGNGENIGTVSDALASTDGTIQYVIVQMSDLITDEDTLNTNENDNDNVGDDNDNLNANDNVADNDDDLTEDDDALNTDNLALPWDAISFQLRTEEELLGDDRDFAVVLSGDMTTLETTTLDDNFLDFLGEDGYVLDDAADDDDINVPAEFVGLIQVSDFDDFDLQDMVDNDLGDAEDLLIDTATGQILYAVTDVGGFLGIGENSVAIPWSVMTMDTATDDDEETFRVNVDEEFLEGAPTIELDDWLSDVIEGWDEDIQSYWSEITSG